jgi:DNA invertase Pin-like site-specific DNA recombinase
MPAPRRTGVSYSRFSSPLQATGDSADRQERLYRAFCVRHNLTPGKEVFADRGRSGYHGEHRTKGKLGQLIEAAKDGRFDPGTVVVIEAWDRLGRLRPDRQTELVAELLRTGVSIGVCRLDDVFTEEDFGSHKWTTLAVFIQLAHQESKQKAERVSASWDQRRKKAREEGAMLRSSLPAWIEVVDGEPRLIPERAAVLKRIFKLAADGIGHTRIVRTLDAEKVPPFGEKVVRAERTRSQFAGVWTKPYVALLLRDRRVLGELQPLKGDKPDGPPLKNYFPAAVTEEQFALARAGQDARTNYAKDALGRKKSPRQSKYVNVFRGMLTHARDGGGFLLHNKGTGAKPDLILITADSNGGRGPRGHTFPYDVFEEKVLGFLEEIDPASVLPEKALPSSADVIRAKLKNTRDNLARYKEELRAGFSKTLAELVREAEQQEEQFANDLHDELARTARPLKRTWGELPSLIDVIRKAPDPDAARLKLRPALRAIVESAHVLIVPSRSWRFAVVQFQFVGGARRDWVIMHQAAANKRAGGTAARSLSEMGWPAKSDLRAKAAWEKLEKLILKHAETIHDQARQGHAERKREAARAKHLEKRGEVHTRRE